jgi:DNA-binding transcriptional regulator of glucitol operon
MNNRRLSPRKQTRAIIVLAIIVVIGVILLGWQYFAD